MRDSETAQRLYDALNRYRDLSDGCGPEANSGVPMRNLPGGPGGPPQGASAASTTRLATKLREAARQVPPEPPVPAPPSTDYTMLLATYRQRFTVGEAPTMGQVAEWQRLVDRHTPDGSDPPRCRYCRAALHPCHHRVMGWAALVAAGLLGEDEAR